MIQSLHAEALTLCLFVLMGSVTIKKAYDDFIIDQPDLKMHDKLMQMTCGVAALLFFCIVLVLWSLLLAAVY